MSLGNFGINIDRSMRIVFVGDIPHEVTESNLKDLFLEYGPVLNIRFFKNVTSQYAFCEYGEPEMAARAKQSLSNYTVKGRALRVDLGANNRTKEELASFQEFIGGGNIEAAQAMDVTEKAPEEISKAVASLPAEQMFELMKQMKMCIENNPQEARNLLLQNPQLAYALLQAQVIMRIVDPEVALKILDRPNPVSSESEPKSVEVKQTLPPEPTAPLFPSVGDKDMRQLPPADYDMRSLPLATADKDMRQVTGDLDLRTMASSGPSDARPFDPRFRPADPRAMQGVDPRGMQDPRAMQGIDPRSMQAIDPRAMTSIDPRAMQALDPRAMKNSDPRAMQQGVDPRMMPGGMIPGVDPRMMPGSDPRSMGDPRSAMDPRGMMARDPRTMSGPDPGQPGPAFGPRSAANIDPRYDPRSRAEDPRKSAALAAASSRNLLNAPPLAEAGIPEDEEKAALIMQVLQLSEEQIAMLPPEQRQSIMVLKEQIARSQHAM